MFNAVSSLFVEHQYWIFFRSSANPRNQRFIEVKYVITYLDKIRHFACCLIQFNVITCIDWIKLLYSSAFMEIKFIYIYDISFEYSQKISLFRYLVQCILSLCWKSCFRAFYITLFYLNIMICSCIDRQYHYRIVLLSTTPRLSNIFTQKCLK